MEEKFKKDGRNVIYLAIEGKISAMFVVVLLVSMRLIITPVKKSSKELIGMVDDVNNAAADLTKRISIYQKDEVGSLVEGVNTFRGLARGDRRYSRKCRESGYCVFFGGR